MLDNAVLLKVRDLKKFYPVRRHSFLKERGYTKAVDGVSFELNRGEALGLVGESGSGKTNLGLCILRLREPTSGEVVFKNQDITKLKPNEIPGIYKDMQIIFQDPYSSLNPRMRVGEMIGEPLVIYKLVKSRIEKEAKIKMLLKEVGLNDAFIEKYPHELSEGQRQRIVIARALSVSPTFIVCDEPTSALDVSVQAQIINLLEDLRNQLSLTYLFISHDLSVIKHICNRMAVMYLGKIIEFGETEKVCSSAKHPYTRLLISSILIPDPTLKYEHLSLNDEIPSSIDVPAGCRFHPRCPYAKEVCKYSEPVLTEIERGWFVACHLLI